MTEEQTNPEQSFKSGYVAVVGKPNVGKSTLLNHYLGQKIAAVSMRPQTTRRRQLGIFTTEKAQIIFVDTPGLHSGDYKLSSFINAEAQYALMDSDLILFMVDVSKPPDAEDRKLSQEVQENVGQSPVLLVLNKIDLLSPDLIASRLTQYQALMSFSDWVEISAITEAGRELLLNRIIQLLPEGPKYYPDDQVTDIYEREIAGDLIRAAAMQYLEDEVPYALFVRVNDYEAREGNRRYVHATLFVERESHKGIVIGKNGAMIKQIGIAARSEIEEMSEEEVFLDLQVKVEKNWRNNPDFLRRVGLSHD